MGAKVSRDDFEWSYTDEPHATRRKLILEKHPSVKKLMGHDPNFKWIVICMVIFQVGSLFFVQHLSAFWQFVLSYCIAGTINHSLMLAIHEISHNLAFGQSRLLSNRLLGLFANLPIGVPFSITFRKYHLEHHKYQGLDGVDTDIPSDFEGKFFDSTGKKLLWVLLQPFFYALRPMFINPKPPSNLEVINFTIQFCFDAVICYYFGIRCLLYLICGSLMAMGLHPVAGHFISEHYMFLKGHETYSYYGPLNWITFNVGYHNEHHDFPSIPGSRLPLVKKMAPEFYDDLPHHNSWVGVLKDFITDPDIGPYSRIKRNKE